MRYTEPTPPRRRASRFNFPWRSLLFLVVVAGVLRVFFCAVLRVPTASMEPTFHGDPLRGDEVLVFNPWFKITSPDRYELACFERTDPGADAKLNVKRIVGLPGESIRIADGDLYVTSPGGTIEKMVEKSYGEFRPLLVRRFFERFGADFERHFNFNAQQVVVQRDAAVLNGGEGETDAAVVNLESTAVAFDNGWIDDSGCDHAGAESIKDVLFDLEVTPLTATTCLQLSVTIGTCDIRFQIVPWASGHAIMINLTKDGGQIEQHQQPIRFLSTGSKHRVEFFQIDGNLGATIDGRSEVSIDLPATGATMGAGARSVQRPSLSAWAGGVRLTRFEIWRDLYYSDPVDATYAGHAASYHIPDGSVFVLGDNSSESTDSRYFGAIPIKDLRGRPFFILSPNKRMGFAH